MGENLQIKSKENRLSLIRHRNHKLRKMQCLVFVQVLFVHHKIYHIQAFTVGFAIAAEAIHRTRFVVHLQARGFIFMERTV